MIVPGERISVFDIFKIGVGPSSSHTMGPWRAAKSFLNELITSNIFEKIINLNVHLYGSLAKTGKGHGTDMAVILGLMGEDPETISLDNLRSYVQQVNETKVILLNGKVRINFTPEKDIHFHRDEFLTYHPNGLIFESHTRDHQKFTSAYYSIGGGFIEHEGEIEGDSGRDVFPYPIDNSSDLLHWTSSTGLSISDIVFKNEQTLRSDKEIIDGLDKLWNVMLNSVYRGCHTEGFLPGVLNVHRRASMINNTLLPRDSSETAGKWIKILKSGKYGFSDILSWISCFALAVNEENADFGRVVTAPTNGAAGVIPAVLLYHLCFSDNAGKFDYRKFLFTASEIGSIFKKGSTISAAMGGCQAEIGVSSAMAAAALTECLGGNPEKSLMAAEIAMEHHLGLTCDPVAGLVQVPCIERNTMGAVKAITASQLALESDPHDAKVTLDNVIKTMWETAQDMNSKYKETSDGGLAINIPVNIPNC